MSGKQAKVIPDKIHLVSINIFKANLETTDEYLESPQKSASFEFNIGHKIAHNYDEDRSRYRLFFLLNALDADGDPLGVEVEYGIEFHFQVDNLKDLTKKIEEGQLQVSLDLAATLFAMAYSTARGIVFERTRGTFFDGVILPVINPYEALMKDVEE